MRKRLALTLFAGVALASALAACGNDDNDAATSTENTSAVTSVAAPSPPSAPAAAQTPTGPQAITLKAGEYYFDPNELRMRPGAITITMTNDGPERPHTFVVRNRDGNGDLFRSERVPVAETTTLEFSVMEEGTYQVFCSLPGHEERGQRGTLTVARS